MIESKKIDLTSINVWKELAQSSPATIAALFGFVADQNFEKALGSLIKDIVDQARIGLFLPPLAGNFLKSGNHR